MQEVACEVRSVRVGEETREEKQRAALERLEREEERKRREEEFPANAFGKRGRR